MSKPKPTETTAESVYAARPWLNHYNFWVPAHMNYPRRPLYEILRLVAADVPDRPATTFLGKHLTFREIKGQADRFATALARLGIKQGDRVGIMLPNCPQYLIASFAILRLGATVVNINPIYTQREVLVVAQDSQMCALLTLDSLAPAALAVADQTSLQHLIVTSLEEYSASEATCPIVAGAKRMTDLMATVDQIDIPRVEINTDEDVAVLQYTGGTTGVPKGAMLTHYNIFANVIQTDIWARPS